MLGLPPVYREDTARQHQASFTRQPQYRSSATAASLASPYAASSILMQQQRPKTPAELWVERQLPFYEDQYTAGKKCTMLVTTFNVGCKPPPSKEYLSLLVQKELLGKASFFGSDEQQQQQQSLSSQSASGDFGAAAGGVPSLTTAGTPSTPLPINPPGRYQNTTPMDFIVVGLQEVDMSAAALWKEETETAKPWIAGFRDAVGADTDARNQNPNNDYFMAPPKQLVGLLLLFFIRKPVCRFVSNIAITSVATGTMGTLGNKGCVAVRFDMHKSSYCVINAHLAAGQEHVAKRNDDAHTILTQLDFLQGSRGGGGVGAAGGSSGGPSGGGGGVGGGVGVGGQTYYGLVGGGANGMLATQQSGDTSNNVNTSTTTSNANGGAAAAPAGGYGQQPSTAAGMGGAADGLSSGNSGPALINGRDDLVNLTPQDHDLLVFLGDLNYRVDVGYAEGVQKAVEGDYEGLLRRDQLLKEMGNPHTPWKGFVDHTPTKFPPTYRFDIGTNNYDTSEKKRIPAYTDRVLHWVKNSRHRSVHLLANEVKRELMSSDHKPYCCVLSIPYREEVSSLKASVRKELEAKVATAANLDRVSAAKISVSTASLDFGLCSHYTQRIQHTITFTNEGECVAVVTTARAPGGNVNASSSTAASSGAAAGTSTSLGPLSGVGAPQDISGGTWLRCRPLNFEILPGETRSVTVECYLNRQSLAWMSRWEPFAGQPEKLLRSMLVFSVENGPLSAVDCSVRVKPSVFCNSLNNLLALGSTPCAEAYRMGPGARPLSPPPAGTVASPPRATGSSSSAPASSSANNATHAALLAALPRIPKEVWYLCEAILRRAATEKELFTTDTEWEDVARVMEFLDTHNEPIPHDIGSSFALAQCLIDLLKNLQEPVIPFAMFRAALSSTRNGKMPLQVIHEQVPAAHCNLFIYLVGFLRRLLMPNYARLNELDASTLSQIFSKILLLRPPDVNAHLMLESELRAVIQQDQVDAAKFLQFFLGAANGSRN